MNDSYILGQQLGLSVAIWIILYFIFLRKYGTVVNLIVFGIIICVIFAIGARRTAASGNLDSGLSVLHESMALNAPDSTMRKMAPFPGLAGGNRDTGDG
jgi:hypothetical protein